MAQQRSRVALVVGGDDDARAFAGALLEESDLTVVESTSAEEALAYLRNHADEVAFLFADVRLPRSLSGVDLARTVGREWPWIEMVLTSGAPIGADEAAKVPHEVRYMPKPWRALDVLMAAERAIARAH
jgi:CheY-like chemotaxis protein